LTEFFEKRLA